MTVTLDDLITPVTVEEAKASLYTTMAGLGLPTTSWKPKAVVRVIVWVMAALVAGLSTLVVLLAKSGFRSEATGNLLTIHSREVYGVERITATFASGNVTLTNSGGGLYTVGAGELTVQNSVTKATFHNVAAFTLNPSSTATVAVVADVAGSSGTSGVGDVDTIVTTLLGVTCTNAAAFVGTDEETDEELRLRDDATLDAISPNGAAGAYLAVAKTAEIAGVNVGVNRVRATANSSTGDVTVTVAKAGGALTSPERTAVEDAITTGPDACVPLGLNTVTIQSAVDKAIDVTMTVKFYTSSGLSTGDVESLVEDALLAWIDSRPIAGDVIPPATTGKIYLSGLIAAAQNVSPYVFSVTCSLPSSDVDLAADEVGILGTATITATAVTP